VSKFNHNTGKSAPDSSCRYSKVSLINTADRDKEENNNENRSKDEVNYSYSKTFKLRPPTPAGTVIIQEGKCRFTFIFGRRVQNNI